MTTIVELKKMRFQYLNLLYEKSKGDKFYRINMNVVGDELGFKRDETNSITQYLEGEGLMKYATIGGGIAITHKGIREIEEANSRPEQSSQYFPPVNIINIHHMEGSQIQQGNVSSSQKGSYQLTNGVEVSQFLEFLKEKLVDLELNNDDASEIQADISTLELQVDSSRPKVGIIKESLLSIQRILEGASGAIAAQQLLQYVPVLLKVLN